MSSPQNSTNNVPSSGETSAAKITKEQEVYQSLEKIVVSGLVGFLAGSIQKFSQIPNNTQQGPSTPSTPSTPSPSARGSPHLPQPKGVPNLPLGGVRPDEIAGQIARRGGVFAALAIIFTGTLESSQIFRNKQDFAAYVTAGSLTGLSASVFLGAGVKFAVKQAIILGSVCGLYSMMQERSSNQSTSTKPSTATSSPALSDRLEQFKSIIVGPFSSFQNSSKKGESSPPPTSSDSSSENSSDGKR
eukprot:gene5998-6446_t